MRAERIAGLYGGLGWLWFCLFAATIFVVVPALRLFVAPGNPFHPSDYYVLLLGKIICYAMVALAMDLIRGYAGILSLGHGLFFALGGYSMGMYLMREIGAEGSTAVTCRISLCFSTGRIFHGTGWARSILYWCF